MNSQSFAPHHLNQRDMNHDGANVDRSRVLVRGECKTPSRKIVPTREMITTMRTWVITKVSRHKVVLS
jgi:hypothetical protein